MRAWMGMVLVCLAAPVTADDAADAKAQGEAFVRAWDKGDVKAALALYADDARVIWPGEGDEGRGKAAIEALITKTFKMFPKSGLVLKSQDTMPLGDGYIGNVGYWEQTVAGPDGKPATFRVRTTRMRPAFSSTFTWWPTVPFGRPSVSASSVVEWACSRRSTTISARRSSPSARSCSDSRTTSTSSAS